MTLSAKTKSNDYLVSAIISVYNCEKFIEGCLTDLISQSLYQHGKLEIVVINTGSEQNEREIVSRYQKHHAHIVYEEIDKRKSLYWTWNYGVSIASGKYITNANADDRRHPDSLLVQSDYLDKNSDVDLVYSDCFLSFVENETWEQNSKDRRYNYPEFHSMDSLMHFQFGINPVWRKSLHEVVGDFGDYKAAGDWDFNIRFCLLGRRAYKYPRALGIYFINRDTISFADDTMKNENIAISRQYRTMENVLQTYRYEDVLTDTPYHESLCLNDFGIKMLNCRPPWREGRREPRANFAYKCFVEAQKRYACLAYANNIAISLAYLNRETEALEYLSQFDGVKAVENNCELVKQQNCFDAALLVPNDGMHSEMSK